MNLAFTPEQEQLRAAVRRFLDSRVPSPRVRELMDADGTGHDAQLWQAMAGDLGLMGLGIPEEHGGSGGWVELIVVLEEMGRALLPSAYLPTMALAVPALLASGDDAAAKDLLPAIAAGESVATLASVEPDGDWTASLLSTVATTGTDGAWRLSGVKDYVLDGAVADLVLVVAGTPAGPSLFAVRGDDPGVRREQLPTLDQTRRLARVTLDDAAGRLVGEAGDGGRVLDVTLDRAAVALAAEMVGGAQRCLDVAVEYAKTREQFGRPIGSFQAIKHKCAEMLVHVEAAKASAYYAGFAAEERPDELLVVAPLAKAAAAEAYFHAAAENVQIHGGIGFTWEHDAHLHLKRAKSSDLLLGDVSAQRRRLADRIGL